MNLIIITECLITEFNEINYDYSMPNYLLFRRTKLQHLNMHGNNIVCQDYLFDATFILPPPRSKLIEVGVYSNWSWYCD